MRPFLVLLLTLVFPLSHLGAHGGVYRPSPPEYSGPRDIVPPSTPGAARPRTDPGSRAPKPAVTPLRPAAPAAPVAPHGAGVAMTAGGHRGGSLGPDLSGWDLWWSYNRDRFLRIRASNSVPLAVTPGSAENARTPAPADLAVRRTAARVLPALQELLNGDHASADVVTAGLLALARAGAHPRFAAELLPYLADPNQEVAETATLALGVLRAPHLQGLLADLLHDRPAARARLDGRRIPIRSREFAAYALGLLAGSTPLRAVREETADTLLAGAESSRSTQPSLRAACLIALAQVSLPQPDAALARLRRLFQDPRLPDLVRAHVPAAAARLLRGTGAPAPAAPAWVDLLLHRLQDPREAGFVRHACVQALGWMPAAAEQEDRVAVALVRASERDGDPRVRYQALMALGMLASRGGAPAQTVCMPRLLKVLEQGGLYDRGWAALSLGVMGFEAAENGHAVPGLIASRLRQKLAEEVSPSVRGALAIGLALLRDPKAVDPLLKLLGEQKNPELQARAAVALGMLRAAAAGPELRGMLTGVRRRPALLRATAEALALLQDRAGMETLYALLRDGGRRVLATTAAVAQALGATRDPEAVEALLAALGDEQGSDLGRAFAAAALGLLADPAPLPFRARFARCLNYYAAPATLVDPAGLSGLLNLL